MTQRSQKHAHNWFASSSMKSGAVYEANTPSNARHTKPQASQRHRGRHRFPTSSRFDLAAPMAAYPLTPAGRLPCGTALL